jgi:hypothetical protein
MLTRLAAVLGTLLLAGPTWSQMELLDEPAPPRLETSVGVVPTNVQEGDTLKVTLLIRNVSD